MAEDAVVEEVAGAIARRRQRRRADDEAVDQHQHLRFRRRQHGADHHGDLEAAESGQHVERLVVALGPRGQRLFQQRLLARQPGVVEPGAATDAVGERQCRSGNA